ncbi:MAG: tRNA 2-thiouridine(34) synthase MnmA [Flavobacteriales bacterium]
MKRVVVGLSGGVDSSVTALLLKEQGFEVIGMFMRNWHDDSVTLNNECPWIDDSNDALLVAEKLGIPFHVIDLSAEYKNRIVDYMFTEYEAGRTPNPDVLCNREIKFDPFLKAALSLKADYVATGHYCQKSEETINGKIVYKLMAGADKTKDQSYFLCQLNQEQLAKALFPIGHLQKSQVRELAKKTDLITAEKKDSQGLCFVGKISLPEFLQQQLKPKQGDVIEIAASHPMYAVARENTPESLSEKFVYTPGDGKKIGTHQGAHYYTIGQRKGLGIGGSPDPLFVISTNVEENVIYVGQTEHHPGLNGKALFMRPEETHWIRKDLKMSVGEEREYMVRIRYRQPLQKSRLIQKKNGLYIVFEKAQKGITPGQFAVWYSGEELLGSGVIS